MTKKQFIELTGEDPEDMFGPDWKNELEELQEENKHEDSGDITNELQED